MDKKKSWIARFKSFKHKEIVIAVIAVVVMLVLYFSCDWDSTKTTETTSEPDYCSRLETEVKSAVIKMSGDKNAEVIVNWESGIEAIVASTRNETDTSVSITPVITGGKPIVVKEIYPKALGIVVVVKGGSDTRLKIDIISMVATLLDVSPERVAVYASKN